MKRADLILLKCLALDAALKCLQRELADKYRALAARLQLEINATPPAEFEKVTVYSNWCHCDQIGEVDPKNGNDSRVLKHGEEIEVRWENGDVTAHSAIIESGVDHLSRDDIPWSHAYVETDVRGKKIKVPILGMMARRV